jgi:fatty acid synthase subunit beta
MLDLAFRRDNLLAELEAVDTWERQRLSSQPAAQAAVTRALATRKRAAARDTWGQGFFRSDPSVAPLRGALAVWGLTVDDVQLASFHGTSTKLNDKNESSVVNAQLRHLGRSPGNVLPVISQKWLTAHSKGGACAWMLNGLVQAMLDSTVPGNRNLDNVSPELRDNNYLVYPNRSIKLPEVRAAVLKSFGFGQAGAEAVIVHPDRLLATLTVPQFEAYCARREQRERRTFRFLQGVYSGQHTLVQVKDAPPYSPELESHVYLNPNARATFDPAKRTWTFAAPGNGKQAAAAAVTSNSSAPPQTREETARVGALRAAAPHVSAQQRLQVTLEESASDLGRAGGERGLGVDVEPVATFSEWASKGDFLARNFTEAELKHCLAQPSPADSLAGRWAAKEAVVKAMQSAAGHSHTRALFVGAGAPLRDIEVLPSPGGAPVVQLHGHVNEVFRAIGLSRVKVSISHSAGVAVANALAH